MVGRLTSAVLGAAAMLTGGAAASAQTPPGLQVEHAAARLVVIAEARRDIALTIQHGPSRLPPLTIRRDGARLVVDGGLRRPDGGMSLSCTGHNASGAPLFVFGRPVTSGRDTRAVVVPEIGRVGLNDLPVITAHVPLDAHLASGGAVWGDVGATHSLTLASSGCGDWRMGPVADVLTAELVGSGDLRGADVGSVNAHLSGSGDISVGRVAGAAEVILNGSGDIDAAVVHGPLQIALSGSGDVRVGVVSGPVHARIASSGDVRIRSGRSADVRAEVSGSGGFDFAGEAGQLTAAVAGSGDVYVARVDGSVSKTIAGSGEVRVGR